MFSLSSRVTYNKPTTLSGNRRRRSGAVQGAADEESLRCRQDISIPCNHGPRPSFLAIDLYFHEHLQQRKKNTTLES